MADTAALGEPPRSPAASSMCLLVLFRAAPNCMDRRWSLVLSSLSNSRLRVVILTETQTAGGPHSSSVAVSVARIH
jgi:hypothetical protein